MKQKSLSINSVPKSYFDELTKTSNREIGKRLNYLLGKLLVENNHNKKTIDKNFKLETYEPRLETNKSSPIIYDDAQMALELAQKKFSKNGRRITELEIINQVFYQDYQETRGKNVWFFKKW